MYVIYVLRSRHHYRPRGVTPAEIGQRFLADEPNLFIKSWIVTNAL